jgi:hypothetical protein
LKIAAKNHYLLYTNSQEFYNNHSHKKYEHQKYQKAKHCLTKNSTKTNRYFLPYYQYPIELQTLESFHPL